MKTPTVSLLPAMRSADARLLLVDKKMRTLCADPDFPDDIFLTCFDDHLSAGGGRTRAILSLNCSECLGLKLDDAIALAASVELLHNASLIQDDLQDETTLRRGASTVWVKHGVNHAIGLTDLTIAAAFRALSEVSDPTVVPKLIEHLFQSISITVRGQADDLDVGPVGVDRALSVARRKSGPLFALALRLPLCLAGRHEFLAKASQAAEAFGLGYQIYDDIVDAEEDRNGGSRNNIVLALEADSSCTDARKSACKLAGKYLETAASLARDLPSGSGGALADLSAGVAHKLNALDDE